MKILLQMILAKTNIEVRKKIIIIKQKKMEKLNKKMKNYMMKKHINIWIN